KLYCVVNVSERIEIMDLHSCVSLAQISLKGKLPRKIAFYQGKAYVSCFDGSVIKIDTSSMSIEASAKAGRNPEGVCVANGKLYVANSGGLDNPNYDNTVSVFDLSTFTLIKNIPVVINPYIIGADLEGDVYLVSRGNYANVPYSFQRIDSRTDEVVHQYHLPVLNFTISGHYAYLYYYDFDTEQSWIKVMDIISETIVKENFITDGTVIKTPYCITVNPINQDIYIADAHQFYVNGDVFCFSKEGKKKFSFEVGVNPTALVFLASYQDLLSNR
ncbi:MAG: YncE family protein, partial [Bacteroidales bacterium]